MLESYALVPRYEQVSGWGCSARCRHALPRKGRRFVGTTISFHGLEVLKSKLRASELAYYPASKHAKIGLVIRLLFSINIDY